MIHGKMEQKWSNFVKLLSSQRNTIFRTNIWKNLFKRSFSDESLYEQEVVLFSRC